MSTDNKPRTTDVERQCPIRITYLVDFFRTINAGTERQLGHLLSYLPKAGYTVKLISLLDSRFLDHEAPRLFPNISIISLGGLSDISRSPGAVLKLFRDLRRFKPHIVHTFFPTSNSVGVIISRLAGTDIAITSRRDMGYNLSRMDILKLKVANRFVSAVVSNSMAVKKRTTDIEGLPASKIKVIYNGIDVDGQPLRFREYKDRSAVVGIVANLNRKVKRVDLFIEAAAKVHRQQPNVTFWVIGDGHLRPDYERLVDTLAIRDNVKFLGRRKDVAQLLAQIDIGILCSDSEGLSNSIMEYMSAGIPVVATRVGGNPELVSHGCTGLLTVPGSSESLSRAILDLLNDPEKAAKMGVAGREMVTGIYSIEKMIAETKQLYKNCLTRNSTKSCQLKRV